MKRLIAILSLCYLNSYLLSKAFGFDVPLPSNTDKSPLGQAVSPPPQCIAYTNDTTPPFWLHDAGIMVSKIFNECITKDGFKGYLSNSSWAAMGIPCAGKGGKIEVTGFYYNPKEVIFPMPVNCSLSSMSSEKVQELAQKILKLSEKSKLIAFLPMEVQYWEFKDLPDKGTSNKLMLRSTLAKRKIWKNLEINQALEATVYGKEHSWIKSGYIYQIDGEILKDTYYTFKWISKSVKILTSKEIALAQRRCLKSDDKQKCIGIFQ